MFENIKDPTIRQYLIDRAAKQREVQDARDFQDTAGIVGTLGKLGATYADASQPTAIYRNRLQDLGKVPVTEKNRVKYEDMGLGTTAERGTKQAKESLGELDREAKLGMDLEDRDKSRTKAAEFSDPASETSKQYRAYLLQVAPSASAMPGFNELTAERIEKIAPSLAKQAEASTGRQFQAQQRALDRQFQLDQQDRAANRADARLERQIQMKEDTPTVGEKEIDKKFAKEAVEWSTQRKPAAEQNLNRLRKVRDELAKVAEDESFSAARVKGRLPDWLQTDDFITWRDDTQEAAQGALKATLGAQFTEKEGERIMKFAYNPTLSPAENVKKIDRAIKVLEDQANALDDRIEYFNEKGTLTGFTPPESDDKPVWAK